ncbi:hypothetical protein H1164_02075 [Thermoactinomyces daqus]|uniref:Uncharacterized protein n=1 Tax=Thermoactinomyces daqus TaxID=1329516 RepID=A0A7W1X7Y0_9BACL|nr:hypothetical protein [Thermoactinomyces daqus]MBA4541691.1 hypothetical protein [Thermoactinomyces daqus]
MVQVIGSSPDPELNDLTDLMLIRIMQEMATAKSGILSLILHDLQNHHRYCQV